MSKYFKLTPANLAIAAVIAALYAVLTFATYEISYTGIQFRVSEALCVLPMIMPQAIPGLFIGCVISNFFSPNIAILDIIFGSLATLTAAVLTSKIKSKWLAPLPAVLINAVVVGAVIAYSIGGFQNFGVNFAYNAMTVGVGEAVVCYGLGVPLLYFMKKLNLRILAAPSNRQ